jgi:hypothetical protein
LTALVAVSAPETANARGYSTTVKISNCMNSSNALARNDAQSRGTYCNNSWTNENAYWRATFSSRPDMGREYSANDTNNRYAANQRSSASAEHTNSKNTTRNNY